VRAYLTTAFNRLKARPPGQRGPRDAVVLLFILMLAATVRLLPTRAGLPYLHEWDEPQIASTALNMMKTGDLNPHFFHYGTLTIYAQLGVDVAHFFFLMRAHPPPFPVEPGRFIEHGEIDLGSIETFYDTGFPWEVSHPSFYLWNRAFNALLGTATVFVTFLLGRLLAGATAGLLAAALMAVQGFHVELSAVVNPDVAMTLFALTAIWASVAFSQNGLARWLVAALVCCGLAASAKYNGAFSVVAPMAALAARRRYAAPAWLWVAVPVVPALAFLAGTPYALLDLPSFLSQAGFELYHYAARGHGAVPVEPGWGHFALQVRRVAEHFGVVPALVALGGLALLARRAGGLVALVYPALYFCSMATTRAPFHRNLLVVYPLLAIAAAVAVVFVLARLPATPASRWRRASRVTLAVGVPVYLGFLAFAAARLGWEQWERRETRSQAVDAVNAMTRTTAAARVGIAGELRVHRLDLARLAAPYEVRPHLDLVCAAEVYDVIVTGARYAGLWSAMPEAKRQARRLNAALLAEPELLIGGPVDGSNVTRLDALSREPAVAVHRGGRQASPRPEACAERPTSGG